MATKIGMAVGDRVTKGEHGEAGTITHTHKDGWVTVAWDAGRVGYVHVSELWYE